jgi:hypothetical protein
LNPYPSPNIELSPIDASVDGQLLPYP